MDKSPEGKWNTEEQDYRDCLKAVSIDLMDRLVRVLLARKEDFAALAVLCKKPNFFQLAAPSHFQRYLCGVVTVPPNFLPESSRQASALSLDATVEQSDRFIIFLKKANESPFKQTVPLAAVVAGVQEAATTTAASLREVIDTAARNNLSDLGDLLVVFASGFEAIFHALSPLDSKVFFENIDRYTDTKPH